MSSVPVSPFDDIGPNARAAAYEQQAAIDAVRARAAAAKGPTVFLPFGKQRPMQKYAGMHVVPIRPNQCIDRPEMILTAPEPGARYGWVKKDDPRTKGKLRGHVFEPVYIDELKADNTAEISIEAIMTEEGVSKNLVLWHGLMMVKIPERSWFENYEAPALQSSFRMTQHQQAFMDFQMSGVDKTTIQGDAEHAPYMAQGDSGGYRDLRGKAELEMTITTG